MRHGIKTEIFSDFSHGRLVVGLARMEHGHPCPSTLPSSFNYCQLQHSTGLPTKMAGGINTSVVPFLLELVTTVIKVVS